MAENTSRTSRTDHGAVGLPSQQRKYRHPAYLIDKNTVFSSKQQNLVNQHGD